MAYLMLNSIWWSAALTVVPIWEMMCCTQGTVGAAFEGRLAKQPALAVSIGGQNVRSYTLPEDYRIAAQWVHDFTCGRFADFA